MSMPAIPTSLAILTSLVISTECHLERITPPLSSRVSGASREISPLQASTAKIPRLAPLTRDDDGTYSFDKFIRSTRSAHSE
ncbi:hypothetical protein BAQU_0647 [Bifidobacterium aquikefiri]|uniref:Uncharacterized protein n=1 Tax=Bifidobacterium aquikefiri TaxID=1653207 RepID=A0A261G9L8_9BIFI|nr:hypothetical protein BAQU_2014 [Bifidobacterium aquikefiri]OZG67686.1 hypothetical protein BAQU_0778 [Bifidobacterium aquikefiri]OZG68001.1 hypothetical protein BAQU_0647 [Bifidobacterium aquikefiri]